jgi:hypothetical protein
MRAGRSRWLGEVDVEGGLVGERRGVLGLRRELESFGEEESAEASFDDLVGANQLIARRRGGRANSREGCSSTWR